jgi:hypothetical protein
MALITFGYPNEKPKQSRKELDMLIIETSS